MTCRVCSRATWYSIVYEFSTTDIRNAGKLFLVWASSVTCYPWRVTAYGPILILRKLKGWSDSTVLRTSKQSAWFWQIISPFFGCVFLQLAASPVYQRQVVKEILHPALWNHSDWMYPSIREYQWLKNAAFLHVRHTWQIHWQPLRPQFIGPHFYNNLMRGST